jgi:hypothetical protein
VVPGPAGKTTVQAASHRAHGTARRANGALLLLATLAPACLAAARVANVADAAHDAGVARAMGLEAQPWRSLDAVVASLFAALPLGTRAARAGLGEALGTAAAGAALYVVTRRLARTCADAPWIGALTAAIATLAAVGSPMWLMEASAVAGSVTGALLVLLCIAVVSRVGDAGTPAPPPWRATALVLGLAVGYEPLVGACALAACAAFIGAGADGRRGVATAWRTDARGIAACFVAGLTPLLLALARTRAAGVPMAAALGSGWAGERGASHAGSPVGLLRAEVGVVLGALAVGGLALVARRELARKPPPETSPVAPGRHPRPLAAALLVVVLAGFASGWAGAPLGPTRFGAPVLAAMGATCAFAGLAMHWIVRTIAQAKLPLARASAAMVLLLELAIPVDSADEALLRTLPRTSGAAALWDDLAWGELPPRTLVLVTDPRLGRRAAAAQATGALRGDLAVVPSQTRGVVAARVLSEDAALVPLWRDLELAGFPSEASLSSLASVRPLAMAYEPRWGRALGRHLVPVALLDRFEPEPRGASDRRKALDVFAPKRARLAQAAAKDPELAEATAYLLRARALDVAASGDRDLVDRAVDDLRAFAPDDPVGTAIVARLVLGKGASKVDDLRP